MSFKRKKIKRMPIYMSINTILWLSFTALTLFVVAALSIGQYFLLTNTYQDQTKKNQVTLSESIYYNLNNIIQTDAYINSYLAMEVYKSRENVFVFDMDGNFLYPRIAYGDFSPDEDYAAVFAEIQEKEEFLDIVGKSIGYESGNDYYRVTKMIINQNPVYLCLRISIEMSVGIRSAFVVQILFTGAIVIILAFVFAGIISSRISEPIAEMNNKAKKLGKGDFNVDFKTALDSCKEINELSETLNYSRDELSKADQMQKELIANVTHDFKTPLTMIKAYASMIQEISGEIPEKRNKHCQVIIDESDRLANLVNDMLDISKIRSGINGLKPSVFNLSEFTKTIIDRFGYLTETKGYTIETDISNNLYTEADKDKIGQVIYNLVGNAVNYTGEDKKITVRLLESGGCVRFDVTDTGVGIKKEEIDTIWDRYYRSSEMHKRPIKGTGLGLSIVKTVLSKHKFNFGVISEVGKGSTFYVDFPLRTVWNIEQRESDLPDDSSKT